MINHRMSKEDYYLGIAEAVAQRSTCLRRKYGCVIVNNDEIISTGFNGAPRGEANCCDLGVCKRDELGVAKGERYELCLSGDTVIKLLDGTYESIESLYNRQADGVWIYSVDIQTGKIVPAKAFNIHKTGIRKDIVEVVLDNASSVKCTADHLFMMRDGSYKEARNLKYADSLMPMYYNFARNNGKYESISNTVNARKEKMKENWISKTKQTPTHQLVYEYFNGENDYIVDLVHHKDENTLNNCPDNLELIDRGVHSLLHLMNAGRVSKISEYSSLGTQKFIENLRSNPESLKQRKELGTKNMQANWNNPNFVERAKERSKKLGTQACIKMNKDPEIIKRRGRSKVIKGLSLLLFDIRDKDIILTYENYEKVRNRFVRPLNEDGGIRFPSMKTILKYFDTFEDALEEARIYNHKVVEVKFLNTEIPVYDMTVPYFENFAIDLGDNSCIFVHNCRSVHSEQNAIISASRRDMLGATLYITGLEVQDTGHKYANPEPCLICQRFIKNAGIEKVIGRAVDGSVIEIKF